MSLPTVRSSSFTFTIGGWMIDTPAGSVDCRASCAITPAICVAPDVAINWRSAGLLTSSITTLPTFGLCRAYLSPCTCWINNGNWRVTRSRGIKFAPTSARRTNAAPTPSTVWLIVLVTLTTLKQTTMIRVIEPPQMARFSASCHCGWIAFWFSWSIARLCNSNWWSCSACCLFCSLFSAFWSASILVAYASASLRGSGAHALINITNRIVGNNCFIWNSFLTPAPTQVLRHGVQSICPFCVEDLKLLPHRADVISSEQTKDVGCEHHHDYDEIGVRQ